MIADSTVCTVCIAIIYYVPLFPISGDKYFTIPWHPLWKNFWFIRRTRGAEQRSNLRVIYDLTLLAGYVVLYYDEGRVVWRGYSFSPGGGEACIEGVGGCIEGVVFNQGEERVV